MRANLGIKLPVLFVILGLSACSVAPQGVDIHDPNEAHNREVHEFNRAFNAQFDRATQRMPLDPELTKPIANFADNVGLPGMVVNGLLQADFASSATNAVRFILNSTVGIGGLFDPATAIGLVEEETDFGETLSVWGAPEGAYIELPFLGPTTERALAGRLVDMVLDPLDRVGTGPQIDYGTGAKIAERVIRRTQLSGAVTDLFNSADSYAQQRLVYYQNRRFELGTQAQEVDPYDDLYPE